jgi:hypothetical protein
MENSDYRIENAVKNTQILRLPQQSLETFGRTNIYYYLLTEPAYSEIAGNVSETVVREGRVITERPRIVTPYYLSRLEGFSADARKYFDEIIEAYGADTAGLLYTYRNEPKEMNIISDKLPAVVDKLNADIDQRNDPLVSIIKGEDTLWDVSLLKFIFEITSNSLHNNIRQLDSKGLLNIDKRGVPAEAKLRINELFRMADSGVLAPQELKRELDRWNLFAEYEDRFFTLFKK